MENYMRIAIILNYLRGGGAERIAGFLSKYLSKRHEVFLFLENPENIVYEYGGTIIDVGKDGGDYIEYHIKKAKELYNIDVSISFMEPFNHINVRTAEKDAVILSERCYQSLIEPREWSHLLLNKQLYPVANHIVAISEGVRQETIRDTSVNERMISTVYNFFDADRVRKLSLRNDQQGVDFEYDHANKYIVSIGRLEEQKDHLRLIRQFKYLYEKNAICRLVIVGSGSMEGTLRSEAKRLNLNEVCTFIPYSRNPFYLLRKADVFVLPSRYEGYGNVILEAMALGVPVVSVDCPAGPREILDDDTDYSKEIKGWRVAKRGILVSREDSDRDGTTTFLADAISHLLEDVHLKARIVDEAMRWIEGYSDDVILREWNICINKAIEDKKKGKRRSCPKIEKGKPYIIYGTGVHAEKVFRDMMRGGYEVESFVVTKKTGIDEFNGKPVYGRDYLLEQDRRKRVIMGVSKFEYANEICKWFMENDMYDVIFYPLSRKENGFPQI